MRKEIVLGLNGPDLSELERVNAVVEELAAADGWPADLAYHVALVLEELEMNVMQHAYEAGDTPESRIVVDSRPERLTIDVFDRGRPFNPLEDAPKPDLETSVADRKVGGLGVHMVRELMDKVIYRREGDKNHLTLIKDRE